MSGEVWKIVETNTGKIRMVKTKERRSKRGSREEIKRERGEKEKETKKRKDSRSEKSSRRIEDLGGRRRSSKVRGRSKEVGSREIS